MVLVQFLRNAQRGTIGLDFFAIRHAKRAWHAMDWTATQNVLMDGRTRAYSAERMNMEEELVHLSIPAQNMHPFNRLRFVTSAARGVTTTHLLDAVCKNVHLGLTIRVYIAEKGNMEEEQVLDGDGEIVWMVEVNIIDVKDQHRGADMVANGV